MKFRNKNLNIIRCLDNSITRDQKRILTEQAKFYRKLYAKNLEVKFTLQNTSGIAYSNEQKEIIDEEFTF